MKDILDALKSLLPLLGGQAEKIVLRANMKVIFLRLGHTFIFFVFVVGLCIRRYVIPDIVVGLSKTPTSKILYALSYGVFFLFYAVCLGLVYLALDFAIFRNYRPRLVTASVVSLTTLLLMAAAAWLLSVFVASFLSSHVIVNVVGLAAVVGLALYILARFTLWNYNILKLTPTASALTAPIALFTLMGMFVILWFTIIALNRALAS